MPRRAAPAVGAPVAAAPPGSGSDSARAAFDASPGRPYAEILPDEKAPPAPASLARPAAHSAAAGTPAIERVMPDTPSPYRHSTAFHDTVTALGARQKFI